MSDELKAVGRDPAQGIDDPWKHRSEGMRCRTCVWYVVKVADPTKLGGGLGPVARAELGRCRRHAPTMNGYPAVFPTDWCGDHRLDENRL